MAQPISLFTYPSARKFVAGMKKQSEGEYQKIKSYFRSGFPELAVIESKVAKLLDVDTKKGESVLLTTSGMSAVVNALEIANLTKGDVVIHGPIEYSKISDYINDDLQKRGVVSIEVDVNDVLAIDAQIKKLLAKKLKVKAIFLETIGNGPSMPALDIEKFFKLESLHRANPLIIIDNTLPTELVIPLIQYMRKNPKLNIVGVQSATKFYLLNRDLGGILYVVSQHLKNQLLTKRTRIGATPGMSLVQLFEKVLPSKVKFYKDMQIFMRNTLLLASACAKAEGAGKKFVVCHPNLNNHPNCKCVQRNYLNGVTPVFFITSLSQKMSSEEIFYKLEKSGALKNMVITESFGFERTGISHGTRLGSYIRVAGGLESLKEITIMANRLNKALSSL